MYVLLLWVFSIPDHHFDRIHPDTQPFARGDYIRDTSTAVCELSVKVHPLSGGRLSHDVDVNLQEKGKHDYIIT